MSEGRFHRSLLAMALTAAASAPAGAVDFSIGEIQGQFDSSLSVGASWQTQSASQDLIDASNGGNGQSSSNDDGRLNFKKGETFSKIFKGLHDLELRYGDTSAFVRGKYWYDFELKDEHRPFKDIDDSGRDRLAKSSGAEFLDAFINQNYELFGQRGNVRLGKQVVSWGESTFIGNSINVVNPIDISAVRRPGAELKEALLPVNLIYASQGITDSLNVEGFYQIEWDHHALDNCGTFFGNDAAPKGCNDNFNSVFGGLEDDPTLLAAAQAAGLDYRTTSSGEGLIVPRTKNRDARDGGQFGLALRWLNEDTEYSAYFVNYHSRSPQLGTHTASGVVNYINSPAFANALPDPSAFAPAAMMTALGTGSYFLEYPEDIRLYGLAFATTLPTGTAWSGEISYRPNAPVGFNSNVTAAAMLNPVFLDLTGSPATTAIDSVEGADNKGYRRKEVTQAQTTFIHLFDPMLGANSLTLLGEVGVTHIGGLERLSEVYYGRDTVYGDFGPNSRHGFFTSTSWGYRTYAELSYDNLIAGWNVKPNVAFSHDVDGYGPVFNEGSKAVGLGIDANYRSTYTASLAYTNYFDGDYNTNIDRDNISLSFGVNF
ncbi:DUF1302 domain-containing protein [Pseudomonas sp. Milli4]|uniref:DUF1302 domain-containing protein n=2 Tax=Pseudomonas schmalbachii TaxID=2816993 RepID=A0ABS3TTD2_9PSED|nr:DUF1302 domain-containing protein [Pseudomonas schmalbachii]